MSVLAQVGHGRGTKIEKGLDDGVIRGAIMSPRDERRDHLEYTIRDWRLNRPDALILFDPQFYAANLNSPRDGHLSEYDYYDNNSGLGRTHFSGSRIRRYVEECLEYQRAAFGNGVSYFVSPTILFDAFRDSWSQVALNLAAESAEYHSTLGSGSPPLLVSLVISETAFQTLDAVEEFLDALTEIDVRGFYIIVRRNGNSLQNAMEASPFAHFMYFCHVLATINEYDVIVGYSDWQSFLLEAAGVKHTATGWYQNLRQFSLARFRPSSGGRRPRKRYSSAPLLSCPLITPELQDLYAVELLDRVLSGSQHDNILRNNPTAGEADWSDEVSCLAHWFSLNVLSQRINAPASQAGKLEVAGQLIRNALTLYAHAHGESVSFDPSTGSGHIREWHDSLREFRALAGL